MNLLRDIEGATFAFKSLILLALLDVVNSNCPNNAIEQMHACTAKLANMTSKAGENIKTVEQSCRNLMEVPLCLESILYKCQGHSEFQSIDRLKQITNQWKSKFHIICSNITSDTSSAMEKRTFSVATFLTLPIQLLISRLL
ncbi:hypothetical protein LOTGIDRAFT_231925 [Lottia gigantea]|uniref:Uncharacterized protein n=1 Tax=Lottia gigantea TaxID=225164 RepID=V3ZW25_LOTGI|nr:hypothetical protein LOTGIDRAFT_231925 [Lottia gigantea]ESO95718.1 hypothetical protein LOTGIDRAFT_231925 [Lottia gigantea]